MTPFSPVRDSTIARHTASHSLEEKVKNKMALQKQFGWPQEPKCPLFCLPAGMNKSLGGVLLKEVLPGLLTLNVQLVIRGKGSNEYGSLFTELAKTHNHRIAIIPDTEARLGQMFAAADAALFLADPSTLPELKQCLNHGVVPIAPECTALENYNPVQESGNAFLYEKTDPWHCFAAIVRALETHVFPFDWRTIQRHCMENSPA